MGLVPSLTRTEMIRELQSRSMLNHGTIIIELLETRGEGYDIGLFTALERIDAYGPANTAAAAAKPKLK